VTFRVRFAVPGEPRGKGSVRTSVIGKKKPQARTFTDPATRKAMDRIQDAAVRAMEAESLDPCQGPLTVGLYVYRAKGRPTSKIGKDRAEADQIRPVTKPDLDNYSKAALDAMNGVCYRDDAQVVRLVVEKRFSERPRMEIVVQEWEPRT